MDKELIKRMDKINKESEEATHCFVVACNKASEAFQEFAKEWKKGITYFTLERLTK